MQNVYFDSCTNVNEEQEYKRIKVKHNPTLLRARNNPSFDYIENPDDDYSSPVEEC